MPIARTMTREGGGKQKNKANASSPKGGKRRDSDLIAKEELLKALTRQAEENTRILERERAQMLAEDIRTVELGGGGSGLPPHARPPPAGGKKGLAPALQVGNKGGAPRAHVFMPQNQGAQATRYDPSMIPGLGGGGGGGGGPNQGATNRAHPFAPPLQIAPSPSPTPYGPNAGGGGRGGKFLGGPRPPSTLEGTFPDTPGFFPGMVFAVPSGGGGGGGGGAPPSPIPGQYMQQQGGQGGQAHEGVGGWMTQGPPSDPYYPNQDPQQPYAVVPGPPWEPQQPSPSGGGYPPPHMAGPGGYPLSPGGGQGQGQGQGGPAPLGPWVSPPPSLPPPPHSQMMMPSSTLSPYGMDPSPPQGRKSAFMGALTDIRAGPTEEQRKHREDQRAQLQRDLDEQIRQKRDKEARMRADEERTRAKEEAEHRAYVDRLRLQHQAEERARRGEEDEGMDQDQPPPYHIPQYPNTQGYSYPPPTQAAHPPQKILQPPPRMAGPPQPQAAPVIKKAGGPFGSVAVDDSGGHIVARRKNKKIIEADWLDAGRDVGPAYDPAPDPHPRPPSPPSKAPAAKPIVVVKAGGPFGTVAVDDSGGHVLSKHKNRHKRIIEADWLDNIQAPSSQSQEPPNPLAAIVRRSVESHPPAPGPSISPRDHSQQPQGAKPVTVTSGSKDRSLVGTSGGALKGDVAAMLLELQKEQVRLRDEFKKHSEAMQKIVQGAGDVASSRDRAWQDLDRIRSRLSANVGEVAALGASLGGAGALAESNGEFKVVSTHLLPREANAIPSRLATPIEAQWIQDEIQELQMGQGEEGLYGIGEEEGGDYLNLDDGLYHHLGQSRSRLQVDQDQRGGRGRGPPPVSSNIPVGVIRIASRGIMGGFGGGGGGGGGGAMEKKPPAPVAFGRRAAAAPPVKQAASSPKGRNTSSARPSEQPAFGRRATSKPPVVPSSARGGR